MGVSRKPRNLRAKGSGTTTSSLARAQFSRDYERDRPPLDQHVQEELFFVLEKEPAPRLFCHNTLIGTLLRPF